MVLEALARHPPPAVIDADPIVAEPQPVDEPDEVTTLALERVADVGPVPKHAHVVEPPLDPYQRFAAADLVGAARQHVDVDMAVARNLAA